MFTPYDLPFVEVALNIQHVSSWLAKMCAYKIINSIMAKSYQRKSSVILQGVVGWKGRQLH